MNADNWRLEDIKFHDQGGKRRTVLGPVIVVESGGKYSVTMTSHHVRVSWNDLDRKHVDSALDAAFDAFRS